MVSSLYINTLDQKHLWANLSLLLILAQPQLPSGDRGSPTEGLCASPHGPNTESHPVQLVSMEPHTTVHSTAPCSRQLHFPGTFFLGLNTLGERGPSDLQAAQPPHFPGWRRPSQIQEAHPWSHLAGDTKQGLCFLLALAHEAAFSSKASAVGLSEASVSWQVDKWKKQPC